MTNLGNVASVSLTSVFSFAVIKDHNVKFVLEKNLLTQRAFVKNFFESLNV